MKIFLNLINDKILHTNKNIDIAGYFTVDLYI